MVNDKDTSASHVENSQHEALLTGAVALASLFSSCVEAFGLIHPSHKWDKEEQLLLTRLGLQQARLLIWGSVLGVSAPPASVTNSAVPRYPSSAYPDVKEPTFFDTRDPRLDDPNMRTIIEQTLSEIVDRSSTLTREEMMAKYGLKPPKKITMTFEPSMDPNRLESFRERWELLREVAESYAQINTRRNNSIVHSSWSIADVTKFGSFIKLIQEKVDYLIDLMDVKDKVDRGMRMDIRMFGWHIAPDRVKTAQDISKLRLLQEICKEDYPEYVTATQQALDHISRETRENAPTSQVSQRQALLNPNPPAANGTNNAKKRPGLLKIFRSFTKSKDSPRSHSISSPTSTIEEDGPARSQSHPGVTGYTDEENEALGRVRSKSVGAWIEPSINEALEHKLEKLSTKEDDVGVDSPLQDSHAHAAPPRHNSIPVGVPGSITRHDQYHGIARTETKNLCQPGGNFDDK